nr:DNA methyltransferase [Corynebacterium stationis]
MSTTIIHGDCLEELKKLEDNSVDAVITDPPYGLSNTKPAQVADVLKAWVTGDTVSVPAKRGGFMGADWDSFVPPPAVWEECMRVLKPGGHMAVFAGARTQDLMGLSIRLAGFRIKDTLGWIFGSGFPKSHNPFKGLKLCPSIENAPHAVQVSEWHHHELSGAKEPTALALAEIMPGGEKALLIKTGKEESLQELTVMYLSDTKEGTFSNIDLSWKKRSEESWKHMSMSIIKTIADQIIESKTLNFSQSKSTEKYTLPKGIGEHGLNCRVARVVSFSGESDGSTSDTLMPTVVDVVTSPVFGMRSQGTQIKPAIEPIILAQKPLDGTVAANVLAHGVGGLNIDACRVQTDDDTARTCNGVGNSSSFDMAASGERRVNGGSPAGRFPANVLLDEHAAKEMDKQSGVLKGRVGMTQHGSGTNSVYGTYERSAQSLVSDGVEDSGGASRFFPVFKYQAKAPKRERPVIEREDGTKIQHATVKPLALMEWLVSLIVPPGGVVLDPFAGSGTTLQAAINKGFHPIGIEQDADYIKLIEQRLAA